MTQSRRLPLPLAEEWTDADAYVDSLLSFVTTSTVFRNLCGGVHITDFFTRKPDVYETVLPEDWRAFFDEHDIMDILDLLLREDLSVFRNVAEGAAKPGYRGKATPPDSLVDYVHAVRRHSLKRDFDFTSSRPISKIPQHVAIGMKPKKKHEVENFSRYVDQLADRVSDIRDGAPITHLVDFGSGQNFLGRILVGEPYDRNVIAIERRHQFITGAVDKDATVARKKGKGKGKQQTEESQANGTANVEQQQQQQQPDPAPITVSTDSAGHPTALLVASEHPKNDDGSKATHHATNAAVSPKGSINYIEHEIQDGYLESIIKGIVDSPEEGQSSSSSNSSGVMVLSLHSCGNLVHHGIRSLILNPSVHAIAMIGCCYNLMTERLGPVSYKLPTLRSIHPRVETLSNAYDPHGFPMSKTLEQYPHEAGRGITFNITARMMAVQAPYNWGLEDSRDFFTRHFYRALFQRVLVDYGIPQPSQQDGENSNTPRPLIVGSMRKANMVSFTSYARAALAKLSRDEHYGAAIRDKVLGISDSTLAQYEQAYASKKKTLSVIWTLMAFSAGVVESIIVTDRWLFLREQPDVVRDAWVETAFEYAESPRNLVVVGVKR